MGGTLILESALATVQNLIVRNSSGNVFSSTLASHNIVAGVTDASGQVIGDANCVGSLIAASASGSSVASAGGEASLLVAYASGTSNTVASTSPGTIVSGFTAGSASGGVVAAYTPGAFVQGYIDSSSSNCTIKAFDNGFGAFVKGYAQSSASNSSILGSGLGSTIFGQISGTSSVIQSPGNSSFINAFAGDGGSISSSGDLSTIFGIAIGAGSQIYATSEGSKVFGKAGDGGILGSSNTSSVVMGLSSGSGSEVTSDGEASFNCSAAYGGSIIRATNGASVVFVRADYAGYAHNDGEGAFLGGSMDGGEMYVSSEGSFLWARVSDSGSVASCQGDGAVLMGRVSAASTMTSSGGGSFVGGDARGAGSILGTNDGTFTWAAVDNSGIVTNSSQGSALFGFAFDGGSVTNETTSSPAFLWGYSAGTGSQSFINSAKSVGFLISIDGGASSVKDEGSFGIIHTSGASVGTITGQSSFLKARVLNGTNVELQGQGSSAFITDETASGSTLAGDFGFFVGDGINVSYSHNFIFGKSFDAPSYDNQFVVGFNSVRMKISAEGVMVGDGTPATALLHLAAGTASANTSPLKFTSGTNLTTPEAGALEYNGNKLYHTNATAIRESISGCIFTQTSDKTISNTTTETTMFDGGVGTLTLPANFFVVGKTLRLRIGAVYTTPGAGTPSLVIKIKYGSTVLASVTTSNLDKGVTNKFIVVDTLITCRSTGSSGTVISHGTVLYYNGSVAATIGDDLSNGGSTATINTTTSNAMDITATWDSATSTRSLKTTIATVEVLN
jgi:hypothetical protein